MDGDRKLLDEERRRRKPHVIYADYIKLYNAITGFIDKDYYGYTGWDRKVERWVPKHANSNRKPYPVFNHYRNRWERSRFLWREMFRHSWSQPSDEPPRFYFLVNSPSKTYALICFDVDGDDPTETGVVRSRLKEECLAGMKTFDEPSRNRKGCYSWLIVERTSSPAQFNLLCNKLTVELRRRYHDLGEVDRQGFRLRRKNRVNFFDGIKATLHFDDRDPNDLKKMFEVSDGNPNDNHRGLLATMPCSGWKNDGVEGSNRVRSFLRFLTKKKGVYLNAVKESQLRDLLGTLRPQTLAPSTAAPLPLHQSSPSQSLDGSRKNRPKKLRRGRHEARQRLMAKARSHSNPQGRMRFASSLFFYEFGRYAHPPEELVAYYEKLGFNTGTDDKHLRPERAQIALEKHKSDPAKPVNEEAHYEADFWLPIIRQFVTEEVRTHPKLGYGYRIEDDLLAAGLFLFTLNAMKKNVPKWMHTCGQPGQRGWYETLHDAGVLTKGVRNNNKRNAVMKALQMSGLIVLRDSHAVYGGPERGVCQKFGLGVNHPLFESFKAAHGHIVDPKSLPNLVHVDVTVSPSKV